MLSWHQAEPRGHVATVLELAFVTDGRDYCGGNFWPNTPNASYLAASLDLAEQPVYAPVEELMDAAVDL